jgi:hypothetical protein
MLEIWKDVPGYEGFYKASDRGNFVSCGRVITEIHGSRAAVKTYPGRLILPLIYKTGYRYITFSKNGFVKRYRAHIVIAKIFVPNPYNYPEINHKDENKGNNAASNLEWCSHVYNINYGTGNKRKGQSQRGSIRIASSGENNHNSKLTENQVKSIYYDIRTLKEIANEYSVSFSLISLIKRKKTWKQVTMQLQ